MRSAALRVELIARQCRSLKDKRAVIRPILDGARNRYRVAAAEVGHQGSHQLATLGFAAVAADAGHVTDVLDEVERFIWSFTEIEVLETSVAWTD